MVFEEERSSEIQAHSILLWKSHRLLTSLMTGLAANILRLSLHNFTQYVF